MLERVGVNERIEDEFTLELDCDTNTSVDGTLGDFLVFFNFDFDSVQPIICASKTTCDYQRTRSKYHSDFASAIMNRKHQVEVSRDRKVSQLKQNYQWNGDRSGQWIDTWSNESAYL